MKKLLFCTALAVMTFCFNANVMSKTSTTQVNQDFFGSSTSESASLTIVNSSDYKMTIKIMNANTGHLYKTLYIPSGSSSTAYFTRSGNFYTKLKAEPSFGLALYKKDSPFFIQCDDEGYSKATITYYVSGSGSGNLGKSISKSEFEEN